jgi:hypothetical protein
MKKRMIELGEGADGPVYLDLDILLRTRGYVSASSGGGKSHLLRRLIEQISPHVQCFVLDWEGEFSTLRKKFPFVLVGEGGETPAHPHTAAQVALTLLKLGTSAVCDLYELKGNGRHEFVRNFVNAMVTAPKELWHPVLVIVDEAHYLCPENGYGESVAKEAIIDLCNLGRKRGFCPVLATQRASKVSKNAVEPLQNFLIGLTMPDDHKRVTDTFKVAPGKAKLEFEKELMSLEQGQFFVRGAAISKEQQLIMVGPTETQPPPTGSAAAAKVTATPEAIKKLLPQLADIPVEADRKAKTEAELRTEIQGLKKLVAANARTIATTTVQSISPTREKMLLEQINTLETNLSTTKRVAGAYEKAMDGIYGHAGKMQDATAAIKGIVDRVRQTAKDAPQAIAPKGDTLDLTIPYSRRVAPAVASATRPKPSAQPPDGPLTSPEQRILDALAWLAVIGVSEPEQPAIAFLAGYTASGGSFNNTKSKLKSRGFIEYKDGSFVLTEAGEPFAASPNIEPSNKAMQEAIMAKLAGPERRLLEPLIAAYPTALSKEELATASGYTMSGGSFNNTRSRLKSLGLVSYVGGQTVANALLFPEGE